MNDCSSAIDLRTGSQPTWIVAQCDIVAELSCPQAKHSEIYEASMILSWSPGALSRLEEGKGAWFHSSLACMIPTSNFEIGFSCDWIVRNKLEPNHASRICGNEPTQLIYPM